MTPDEIRDLQERAFQLDELTKHPGWVVLQDFVVNVAGLRAWQDSILGGSAKTTDQYQHLVGKIAGCEHALYAPRRARELADKYSAAEVVSEA